MSGTGIAAIAFIAGFGLGCVYMRRQAIAAFNRTALRFRRPLSDKGERS